MKRALAIGAATIGLLGLTFSPAEAAHDRGSLTVGLNGANEVGTTGDPNGSGTITLEFFAAVNNPAVVFPGEPYVCYDLTVRNVDTLTGLHIHEVAGNTKNPRKDTGRVVVNLLDETRMSAGQTCAAVSPETFEGIQDNASEYYVNGHTAALPGGAIRGQLHSFS